MGQKKTKIPTRSRMSVIHRMPHSSTRLLLTLGLVKIISGVAIIFLSLVCYHFDRARILSWSISLYPLDNSQETMRIIWIGLWILFSGLITLLVACRPDNMCSAYIFFIIILLTVVVTGTFAILTSNHVIQHSVIMSMLSKDPYQAVGNPDLSIPSHEANHYSESHSSHQMLIVNIFLLCFGTVSFVISIISFSIVSHHFCTFTVFGGKLGSNIRFHDISTWTRKERIAQWVLQQSQLSEFTNITAIEAPSSLVLSETQLPSTNFIPIHSNATSSTKMSI